MAQVALGIDYLLTVLKRDYNFLKTVFVTLCFINWKGLFKKNTFWSTLKPTSKDNLAIRTGLAELGGSPAKSFRIVL